MCVDTGYRSRSVATLHKAIVGAGGWRDLYGLPIWRHDAADLAWEGRCFIIDDPTPIWAYKVLSDPIAMRDFMGYVEGRGLLAVLHRFTNRLAGSWAI